jgi:hypothetical protein
MTTRYLLAFVITAFSFSLSVADSQYSKISGQDLIQLLLKTETRSKAYHELALRNDPEAEKEFVVFQSKHRNPEVIECPQENGRSPAYAVLSDFLSHVSEESDKQKDTDQTQIVASSSPLERKRELLIDVFTSDGRKINPFECNDNVLDGLMMDMNGDGFIERASEIRYGVEGVEHTVVLNVNRMGEHEQPILSVLFNWGEDEDWDFAFSDREHDGLVEIDFGPFTEAGVVPEVTFHWDKIKQAYIPNTSVFQNHLIVLDHHKGIWDELARVKKEGNFFFKDSRAVSEWDRHFYEQGKLPPEKEEQLKIVSTEYVPKSLKDMTNQEIFSYMGEGRTQFSIEDEESPRTTIPEDFWNLPPKEAALLILQANRSKVHQSKYKISFSADKFGEAPESYSLAFSESAAHSFFFPNYFLKIDQKGSYLLYSAVTNENHYMLRTSDVCYSLPNYDFRSCSMKYDDAKHLLQTIWWLRQIETDPPGKPNDDYGMFSTGDGDGTIQFISNDGSQESFITAETGGWVSTRWTSSFGDEELVGLVEEIFFETLQKRLDPCMKGAPDWWASTSFDETRNVEPLHDAVKHYLALFSENQAKISYALILQAIKAAGNLAMEDLITQLESIKKILPKNIVTSRRKEINDQIEMLDKEDKESVKKIDSNNIQDYFNEYEQRHQRIMSLYNELTSIRHGAIKESALEDISNALDESVTQIHSANNSQLLKSWVNEKRPGWPWALWRLKEIDKKNYVEVLQAMFSTADPEDQTYIIRLIFDADKNRGLEMARASTSTNQKDFTIVVLSVLAEAGTAEESKQAINTLMDYALDPSTERDLSLKILYILVPEENPNRYESPKIDETLLQMLDLPAPLESYESIMSEIARCIFLRTRTKYFEQVLAHYDETNIDYGGMRAFNDILPELTEQQKMKFAEKLRPLFSEGPGMIDEIVITAWASNLTMLENDIQGIATGNPKDVEPEKCMSGGNVEEIKGRCHSARHISSLWNEKDPYTKVKMLISFYVQHPNFENDDEQLIENRMKKLKSDILEAIHKLKPDERAEIKEFLVWCDSKHPFEEFDLRYAAQRNRLFTFIRQGLSN